MPSRSLSLSFAYTVSSVVSKLVNLFLIAFNHKQIPKLDNDNEDPGPKESATKNRTKTANATTTTTGATAMATATVAARQPARAVQIV